MGTLSILASVASLTLFVIYFIGRIITIVTVKALWKDQIIDCPHDYPQLNIVDKVGEERQYSKALVSKEGIRNLKIYSLKYDADCSKELVATEVYSRSFLNIDEAIQIYYDTAGIIPYFRVEYRTPDFRKVSFYWLDNHKNGVSSELIHPKHTFKSFLYYLCR